MITFYLLLICYFLFHFDPFLYVIVVLYCISLKLKLKKKRMFYRNWYIAAGLKILLQKNEAS